MGSSSARSGRSLRNLAGFTGLSCVVIGIYHLALGTASVPGATDANATVDSRERFYNAYFAGDGMAWLRAARRSPIRAGEVRALAGLMLISAVGRVLSLVHNGRPHWFQEVLTAVEFVVPAAFFGLTKAGLTTSDEKDSAS
jgi:succinate dehydrogenase hydrophobic anchor subunit